MTLMTFWPSIVPRSQPGSARNALGRDRRHTSCCNWLHDVVEDTSVTEDDLLKEFGPEVTALVMELTNPSKGLGLPRSEAKRMDRAHLAGASRQAKIIKMLDRIDNLNDTNVRGEDFTGLYAAESQMLASVIGDADPELQQELKDAATRSVER